MWKSAFAGLLCLGLWSGCQEEPAAGGYPVISLGKEVGAKRYTVQKLSRYATSVRYVPLETSDSTLIGRIRGILMENGRIYVNNDFDRCMIFSAHDGRYLGDVGRLGQGPGEFPVLRSMDVLPAAGRVYIFGSDLYCSEYTLTGTYLRRIRLAPQKNDYPYRIKALDASHLVVDLISWEQIANLFYVCDSVGDIRHVQANTQPFLKKNGNFYDREMGFMNRCADEVHYMKPAADTLFAVKKEKEVVPLYRFDYGKYREPLNWESAGSPEHRDNSITLKAMQESGRYLFMNFNFTKWAPEPFMGVFYDHENKRRKRLNRMVYGIFDKEKGQLSLLKQSLPGELGLKNDLDGGPAFWPSCISSDGEMAMYMPVEDFFEYQESHDFPQPEALRTLDFDSNPVVIIAPLKK